MLAPFRSRGWVAYGAAGISVLVVGLTRWHLETYLKDEASFSFFFLAVSIAAWLGGFRPAIFTAIVSCILGNYLFAGPDRSFGISGVGEVVCLLIFILVSAIVGILAEVSQRAVERARKAEREKDDFMATVAHELRSPLSVIHYANALDRISTEPARDHIDLIDDQVAHLNLMIQDLLDISRVTRGKIRLDRLHIDASDIVDGAVVKARPVLTSRGHDLSIDLSPEPMPICVDPVRMEQVLTNLLINAAKYTPDGGMIAVRVAPRDDSAIFTVRDNGIGIDEKMLPRVFDLFVQADGHTQNSEGGLGIGLALVRKIVEMHDGSVRAASPGKNRGSEFTVVLPLEKPAPKPAELAAAHS